MALVAHLNAGLYLGYLLNPYTRVASLRAPLQRPGRGHMTWIRARIKAPDLIQAKTCNLRLESNNLGLLLERKGLSAACAALF